MQASCQKIHDDELPISKNENFDQNNFKHIYNIGINFFVLRRCHWEAQIIIL